MSKPTNPSNSITRIKQDVVNNFEINSIKYNIIYWMFIFYFLMSMPVRWKVITSNRYIKTKYMRKYKI